MGTLGKDFKYKIIKNFLTKEEILLLKEHCIIRHRMNIDRFDDQMSRILDTNFYGDPIMESLMINKKDIIEKETNLELLPTYSFWRMYTLFADLLKHKDRPACEVSATVVIDSDGTPFPIFIDGTPIDLKIGEAVIYPGVELEHWREEYKGDGQAQVFLHYVQKNGKYKDWFRDKRDLFGVEKFMEWDVLKKEWTDEI